MKKYALPIGLNLLAIALLFACAPTSQSETRSMAPFPIDTLLIAEKVPVAEMLSPNYMMLKNDVLFIANSSEDTMLYQYAVPQFDCIYKGGRKGKGPGEFQSHVTFCESTTDDIYIRGYTYTTIRRFQFDHAKQLSFKSEYKLARDEPMNQVHVVEDSMLLYSAIPMEFALKKVNLKTGKIVATFAFEKEEHNESFFDKYRGFMTANDQYIVYVYIFKKQIDLYRVGDFSLYKRIVDESAPSQVVVGKPKESTFYYGLTYAGKNHFYAMCAEDEKKVALQVFDYQGNSTHKYRFDILPEIFVVDEKRNMLYGYSSDLEDYLLRYRLR
ncbi:MAG: TolB-like 6-bladed beta-propeller domain-containing protein [Prevotellaceae bacterium]|jgi:hypothetical protein|nr:TolB-like 6-bladed beta-propeller domain-containing protein [Prevotellaceae bacterium]